MKQNKTKVNGDVIPLKQWKNCPHEANELKFLLDKEIPMHAWMLCEKCGISKRIPFSSLKTIKTDLKKYKK